MRIVPTFLGDSFRSAQRTRLNGFMQGIHESSSFSAVELWLPCDHDELRCVYASVARPQLLPWTQLSCACAFARGTGLPGRVYNHMSAILENRFDTLSAELDPRAPSARMFGLVTAIGMPVATGSRAGVLLLYSSQQIAQLSALSVACTQRMLRIVLASQVHPRFANISTLDLGHIAGLHQQHEHIRGLVDSSKRRRDTGVEQTSVKRACTFEMNPSTPYPGPDATASAPPPPAMHAVDMKPPPHDAAAATDGGGFVGSGPLTGAQAKHDAEVKPSVVAGVAARHQRSSVRRQDVSSFQGQGRRSAEEMAAIITEVEKELGGPAEASILPGASAGQLPASQREPPVSVKSPSENEAGPSGVTSIASALFSLKSRATSALAPAAVPAAPPPAIAEPATAYASGGSRGGADGYDGFSLEIPPGSSAMQNRAVAHGRGEQLQQHEHPQPSQAPEPLLAGEMKECKMDGCLNLCGKRMSYCSQHSCSRKCQYPGANRRAKFALVFRFNCPDWHGAGVARFHAECTKCAQGAKKFCIAHGGGRRCKCDRCA